jgi:hypothetical protein
VNTQKTIACPSLIIHGSANLLIPIEAGEDTHPKCKKTPSLSALRA